MILDYTAELADKGGQLFNATDTNAEYGSKNFDLMVAGRDIMIGAPVYAIFKVGSANCDVGTSYTLEIVADDDGAATNEVSLGSETVVKASLTANTMHVVGPLKASKIVSTSRYIRAKVTTSGTTPTAGTLEVFLVKGVDVVPFNDVHPDTP